MPSLDSFAQSLGADVGDPLLLSDKPGDFFSLCGKAPSLVARPASHEAAARVLARASEAGLGVVPWGGGTGRGTGYPPERYEVALSTERLNEAVEFLKDDLTAVVGAGMTIEALNILTDIEGQTAGLDPPRAGNSTVGGTIMAERSGPMRVRYGRARDRVMRMRVAMADGTTHIYGALVVKNVTGYDMNRLLSGSWGTLAVVTELAVRLYKAPENTGARAAGFETEQAAFVAARELMCSPLSPLWVEVVNAERAASLAAEGAGVELPGPWSLAAAFGEFEEGLADQLSRFEEQLLKFGGEDLVRFGEDETAGLGKSLSDPPGRAATGSGALAMRASGRLDQLPRFAKAAAEAARAGQYTAALAAHAGSGVLRCWLTPEGDEASPQEAWERFVSLCRAGASREQARSVHVRLDSGPDSLRSAVPVWGEEVLESAAVDLMRKIKAEYDPKCTLSPGRFVSRL